MKTIAFDAASNTTDSSGGSFSWSHTCTGSDRFLIVALRNPVGQNVSDVSYDGVSMTLHDRRSIFSAGYCYVYYLANPSSGTHTINVTNSSGNMDAAAVSYTGVKSTGQPDNYGNNSSGASTTYSETISSTVDGCLHVSSVFGSSGNAITAGADTSVRTNVRSVANIALGDCQTPISSAGSNTLNFSASSMSWESTGLIIKPNNDIYTISAETEAFSLTRNTALMFKRYTLAAVSKALSLITNAASIQRIRLWINESTSSSSFSNSAKTSSSWTNGTKESSTFTNESKS